MIFTLSATALAFAGDESAKALKEYEDEVKKIYDQPVDPVEDSVLDAYMLKESEGLTSFFDADREKDAKLLKPLKVGKEE